MPSTRARYIALLAPAGLLAAAAAAVMAARRDGHGGPASRVSFRDRTVLITGGSRGFGLALARRFAAEGARLALLARHRDQLDAAAAELRGYDVAVRTFVCDVRDPDAVRETVAAVRRDLGPVDVLVNNAGVIHVAPIEHTEIDDFRDSLETHFWAPLYLVRACLDDLVAREGHIINVSSIGGVTAVPHLSAYAVGKFALTGLSEALAVELKRYGITVTTATPHVMRTGSHRNAIVRGRHAAEALWFALGSSTPLTSIDADDAARQVVEAARAGRSHVTPGWQARMTELMQAVAPDLTTALMAAASTWLLPSPQGESGDAAVRSRDINLSFVARVFPTPAARRFNQHVAADEVAWATGEPNPKSLRGAEYEAAQER